MTRVKENRVLPTVSVVVPLYNKSVTIGRCLQSIRRQTFQDFEILVVDDGSTDGSAGVVWPYLSDRDRLIQQPNAGASAARNRGIREARGKWVAFLDADDEWEPGYLEAVVNLAKQYPQAGILATGYRMRFPKGRAVEVTVAEARHHQTCLVTDYFRRSIGGAFIWTGCITIPRQVFTVVGEFAEGEQHGEDLDMWARIALHYPIGYDTRILATFHQTELSSKSRMQSLPAYAQVVRSLRKVLGEQDGRSAHSDAIQDYIKHHILFMCYWLVGLGNRPAVLRWLEDNRASDWIPRFARVAAMPVAWPVLRLLAVVRRIIHSRFVLRLMGGQRTSRGVLTRLR